MREPHDVAHRGPVRPAIRPMRAQDLDEVMVIERSSFESPWSPELLEREFEHEWSFILVAEAFDETGKALIVGFVIFWLVHDEVHVLVMAVRSEWRRRGVGKALLDRALQHGRDSHATLATLEVRRGNSAALSLYSAFGFRVTGVRTNYYADDGEDAIVMLKDL